MVSAAGAAGDYNNEEEEVKDGQHREGYRKLYRVKIDDQFAKKTVQ